MMKGNAKIPTKQSEEPDKLRAYHEAGHAVMAFHKGGIFFGITIAKKIVNFKKLDADGIFVGLRWPSKKGTRKNKGLVLLAGLTAVGILRGATTQYHRDRDKSDMDSFFQLFPKKEDRCAKWLEWCGEANQFLSQTTVWSQVKVVATTLLKQRVLTYDEVKLCIESVIDKERKKDFEDYLEINAL